MSKINLIEPYLLGCLLGDGGLVGNLTFASKDLDIVEYVNRSLFIYGYFLKKRSEDPKRSSEYTITPLTNNTHKYHYYFRGTQYTATEVLKVLQQEGYPITSHDTLHSILGISTKTKKSNILKYFPTLKNELTCTKLKDTQSSLFIDLLNEFNLRCKSEEKRIPAVYFDLSYEDRLLVFQGLMDTDGCGSGHRLEFCVANEGLADDFANLATSLGYSYKKTVRYPKYFNKKYQEYRFGKTAYRITLNNIDSVQPFLCKRKLDNYLKNKIGGKNNE